MLRKPALPNTIEAFQGTDIIRLAIKLSSTLLHRLAYAHASVVRAQCASVRFPDPESSNCKDVNGDEHVTRNAHAGEIGPRIEPFVECWRTKVSLSLSGNPPRIQQGLLLASGEAHSDILIFLLSPESRASALLEMFE